MLRLALATPDEASARLGWIRSARIPEYVRDEDGTPHATILFHKELDGVS